jgi:hypothetical protein
MQVIIEIAHTLVPCTIWQQVGLILFDAALYKQPRKVQSLLLINIRMSAFNQKLRTNVNTVLCL